MKKYDDSLFQIGEVAKILGVSRKMILNYEDLGLLMPAVKDEDSGYRYYTADNMTQIRSIRSLQELGLSLKEVSEYYYDTENIENHLQRLMDLRTALDRNIQMLQVRAAKHVITVSIPDQVVRTEYVFLTTVLQRLFLLCVVVVILKRNLFTGIDRLVNRIGNVEHFLIVRLEAAA